MATKNCAYMLDVLIGEMVLKDPPSILDYRRDPLCPILQIQSNVIPNVYIPFLSAENVSNHLGHIRTGHNFLPLEVEESYLNNGKFNFHSGKSCLFTTSSDSHPSDGLLNINILNSFCFPPTVFGTCQHRFDRVGEIKGKLEFYNSQGNIVSYIGICISLKVLGQGVALQSNKLKNEQSYEALKKYTLAENLQNDRSVNKSQNIDGLGIDRKSFSNINDGHSSKRREPALSISSEANASNVLKSIKQNSLSQYKCSYEPLKRTRSTESVYKSSKGLSSEEIALQLAELEDNLNFIQNDHDLQYYEFQDEVHIHPPSIVYSGTDKESEREWNRKLAKLVSSEEDRFYEESIINKSSRSLPSSSSSSIYSIGEISDLKNKVPKTDHKTKECTKQNKAKIDKSNRNKPRLKGWLRSTPVITQSTSLKQPQAKQTRTTLLRKSKTDPELAKQMQLEIERQVKQKLKILDANFKSEMEGFKSKRSHKNKVLNERLCSSKKSGSTEQFRKVKSQLQNQQFVDSNKLVSSEIEVEDKDLSQLDFIENTAPSSIVSHKNIASSQSLHQKELESNIYSKKIPHNEKYLGEGDNTEEYRDTFKQPYSNNVPPSNSNFNEKLDSRKFDDNFVTSTDKRMWSLGRSIDAKVFVENFPEEASIGESLLSNSTKQDDDNEELSISSQIDVNGSKVSDALNDFRRKDSIQENNSFNSNHSVSITKSEPKRNSSRSSTNKLRERKIHESYRNLSNSMDSEMQQKNITLLKKGSGSKSSSKKNHSVRKMKTNTSVSSIVDSDTESQATDISEDILEEDKIDISKNSSYSYSSNRLSSSSDLVLTEGALTAEDSSVASQIMYKKSKVNSDEEVYSKAENYKDKKSISSVSVSVENNSILSGSRSDYIQQSFGKYSYSEDNSIKLPSSKENLKKDNKEAPLGIDDVDSSISDISARIAALLMPRSKPNIVESIQTDSISSYVPSSMDGSLSSLSDI